MKMEREEILAKVKEIVIESIEVDDNPESVKETSRLKEDLGGDSLDAAEVAIGLDKQFGINTSDEDIARINEGTVKDVVDIVVEHLKKKEDKQ